MPTKKKRVGFIPRGEVLEIINKLSFESNLSISKIINILVEEALNKRGLFNLNNDKGFNKSSNDLIINNYSMVNEELFDSEIYDKFLLFLQFKEKMKNKNG